MGVIEVNNLVKQYNGAKSPSVDGVSFSVEKGEFFAFLVPNGAGKTIPYHPSDLSIENDLP